MPLGNNAIMLGVMALDEESMTTVLLSPEGLTLFDATSAKGKPTRVRRALPPFDHNEFAAGLLTDVHATFLPPDGPPDLVGTLEEGTRVCRWLQGEEKTTQIELDGGVARRLRAFQGADLVREIEYQGEVVDGWYPRIVLQTPGMGGYTLDIQLIDHESTPEPTAGDPSPGSKEGRKTFAL